MAGTLTISTLSDGTNSTSSTNCIQGSAKAWASLPYTGGSALSLTASYNVSSVTRNGAGDYTINFTNAMADTNFCVNTSGSYGGGANSVSAYLYARTTTYARVIAVYGNGGGGAAVFYDYGIYVAIFR